MIAGNLEYVLSSLPYLSFRDTVEERQKVFSLFYKYANEPEYESDVVVILDDEAEKFLSSDQFRLYKNLQLRNIHKEIFRKSKYDVVADFSNYVYRLKRNVEQLRIARRNESDPNSATVKELPLNPGTPLEEELQLLKLQWGYLEYISSGHYDDLGALIIYKFKLLLLLRWWGFDQNQGYEKFLKIIKEN